MNLEDDMSNWEMCAFHTLILGEFDRCTHPERPEKALKCFGSKDEMSKCPLLTPGVKEEKDEKEKGQ